MMLHSSRETETCLLLISTMLLKIEFDKIHMTCVCVKCSYFNFLRSSSFSFSFASMFSIFLGISRPAAFATFFFIYKVYLMCTHITCPLDTDFNLVQPLLLSFVSNIFLVVVVVGEKKTKVGQKFFIYSGKM